MTLTPTRRSELPMGLNTTTTFTNFQTGLNMDAADDFIASAIAGGPVTSHVEYVRAPRFLCLVGVLCVS
jgi:hypothetical protein